LDDFGAGYSSFGYLRELPVDLIKLDGRLVRDIDRDPVKAAIATAAITVAHAMGMQTIGEFVENQAVADCLAACGSDFAQGYLYGHPVTQVWPSAQAVPPVEERETVGLPSIPFLGDALPDVV
jgi:Amt family ammonium transporter